MPLDQDSIDDILERYLPEDELNEVNRILYGYPNNEKHLGSEKLSNYDIEQYRFATAQQSSDLSRIVKVAAIQHSIVLSTTEPIRNQRDHIFAKMKEMTEKACSLGANIVCFPETWSMPFGFYTRDKLPWCEFGEDCENGPSIMFAKQLAQQHGIVIISPILERDTNHGDLLWNTAVVISECGVVLGKQRKNHIPPNNGEPNYYMPGRTGQQVFDTKFGKIGVTICFDRHHPQSWIMYALNGAEIVFNPSATVADEHYWPIEARCAAIANSYFTVALNRQGVETFQTKSIDGSNCEKVLRCYGSTYISAPDGSRTKSLSCVRDGILYAELDLNLCEQMKEQFGFKFSQRWPLYKNSWTNAANLSFTPQIIRESRDSN